MNRFPFRQTTPSERIKEANPKNERRRRFGGEDNEKEAREVELELTRRCRMYRSPYTCIVRYRELCPWDIVDIRYGDIRGYPARPTEQKRERV